ncbi:sulfite reductase (NADPH) beta subunit [Humitalea rosea]|uniref:Sulfite reductase (NADPH) beta subunit n=1 Tax=Humitalea rosea TaxID=990373 RepID=A0A2W7IPC3_9PROT|nr:NADPH-dependent assimilatory sulfite reductase hemoprotein subunit [Humitalea rosea]PZW49077.1 sulfite reductase (NADPH) beta subunit [Humitalea rosea]
MSSKPSAVEGQKETSLALRGTIGAELSAAGERGGVSEATYTLLKFHGTYEQFDRDTATPRKQQGLDKEWAFMVRVRCPGGRMTAAQWLHLDSLAETHADKTLRLTSRQGVQFHGVLRGNVKPVIAGIDAALLTSFAACGDVVRNVTTTAAPRRTAVHAALQSWAARLSTALLPKTRAHHDIFLSEGGDAPAKAEEEPLYGPTYLPRKFKIALVHPADNTPDVLTNDLGFIAKVQGGRVVGWQVTIGGGLGMTHNKPATFPRLADPVAFIGPDEVLEVAEAVVRLSRDYGDRADRKHARLKYVLAEKGADWARAQISADLGRELAPPGPLPELQMPELLGWQIQGDGKLWLGLPIPSGRVADRPGVALRTAIREVVSRFGADPVATPQQDLILSNLPPDSRQEVEAIFRAHGVTLAQDLSPVARWSLACVALPTCGQSLAEGERVHAPMLTAVEAALDRHGLAEERLSFRLTGCPNGCARPYAGDIGVVGRAPGLYMLFVGGDFAGTRLSFPIADKVPEAEVATVLEPMFAAFAAARMPGEGFGDFCTRQGADTLRSLIDRATAQTTIAA